MKRLDIGELPFLLLTQESALGLSQKGEKRFTQESGQVFWQLIFYSLLGHRHKDLRVTRDLEVPSSLQ